jgi:hypothetical protein
MLAQAMPGGQASLVTGDVEALGAAAGEGSECIEVGREGLRFVGTLVYTRLALPRIGVRMPRFHRQ